MFRVIMKKKTPINDRDGSGLSVRALAASGGIQFEDLQAEVYRLRDRIGPDRKEGYDEAIRRMARGGALSDTEQRALLELGKRGFAVASDAEFAKFRAYVQGLHKRAAGDPK